MFNALMNLFNPRKPDPALQAAQELHDARLDLLKAEREYEYWKAMMVMLGDRITRLKHNTYKDEIQ